MLTLEERKNSVLPMEQLARPTKRERMEMDMMMGALLAKGIADFTFGGAFLWYLVKFIVSAALAFCAIMIGIRLRKSKNDKNA